MARVLIACEFSGAVRDAFAKIGHYAMSCDLQPSLSPGPHHQGTVWEVIDDGWDLMIAFPPCTYLAKVQIWRLSLDRKRKAMSLEAIEFVRRLWGSPIPRIAIENPVGLLSRDWQRPTQIIHPYYFGDPYQKQTCLWLKNLPPLMSAAHNPIRKRMQNHVNGRMSQAEKSNIKSSWRYFPLTCESVADQWGGELPPLVYPELPLLDTIRSRV